MEPLRDHPRSRGVYVGDVNVEHRVFVDHPRSRGVYEEVMAKKYYGRGIIPARAGFTAGTVRPQDLGRDHPRSRGVYYAGGFDSKMTEGSSPLARGLPITIVSKEGVKGIIPARAGFTLRIPGIPTTSHTTRPRLPSLPT